MTERDRSQIYLELSKSILGDFLTLRHKRYITDAELLEEWNRRYERMTQAFGLSEAVVQK